MILNEKWNVNVSKTYWNLSLKEVSVPPDEVSVQDRLKLVCSIYSNDICDVLDTNADATEK